MSRAFLVTFNLGPCPLPDLDWLREQLFDAAVRRQQRLSARVLQQEGLSPQVRQAYGQGAQAVVDALHRARDSVSVALDAQGNLALCVEFDYDGDLEVSADGRRLWLRQSFEDLLLGPLRASLFERARAALLSDEPPTEADAERLRALHHGFDLALSDANRLDSPGLTIHGEADVIVA